MDDSERSRDAQGLSVVEVQPDQLSKAALQGLAEEFVSRAGTDYGREEKSFESKLDDVLHQIASGDVRIVYDPYTESANLITKRELAKHRRA
ncbi:MAG: YheU family protein [Acidobacteriota bacterium]|nr:YheU family protein [Acidobacteriota bacterium]